MHLIELLGVGLSADGVAEDVFCAVDLGLDSFADVVVVWLVLGV